MISLITSYKGESLLLIFKKMKITTLNCRFSTFAFVMLCWGLYVEWQPVLHENEVFF